jgi:1-acyl-sn-glycerol-3-phosphate acyltransferase
MLMQSQLELATGLAGAENPTAGNGTSTGSRESSAASERFWYRLGRCAVSLFCRVALNMDMQWRAPLPEGPKILAANHPTTTEPFFILTLLSEQTSVLVTGGAFEVPLFGAYLRRAGHVPVLRNSGGATIQAATDLLRSGRTVAIFPEGALSPLEGGIGFHRPRSGVARLALATGAPVIPIGIGLQQERIRTVDVELEGQQEQGRIYTGGQYAITVGKPLWFEGNVENWDYVRLVSERIMQRIVSLSQQSALRLQPAPAIVPSPAAGLAAWAAA